VGVHNAFAADAGCLEDGADLAGETEVGVDEPKGGAFTPSLIVARHRRFHGSGAG